jgi:hypothetical protein
MRVILVPLGRRRERFRVAFPTTVFRIVVPIAPREPSSVGRLSTAIPIAQGALHAIRVRFAGRVDHTDGFMEGRSPGAADCRLAPPRT